MRSFVFWLSLAAAFGAILAVVVHPGVPEIVIVFAVINALHYGIRGSARKGARSASTSQP